MDKRIAPSMRDQLRDHDWASTPLGPRDTWPVALKITVDLILRSEFPKCLCWGPEMIAVYNDAFVPILGDKHPCLGQPFSRIWSEAWDDIGPIARRALEGESTFIKDFPLVVDRGDGSREGFFTFCYSPIADENGRIVGFMDTVIETTGEVLAGRRIRLLNEELRHRIKNSYAKAIAILRLTFRRASSPEAALEAALSRLKQLDHAQRALLEDLDGAVEIRTLIGDALADNLQDGTLVLEGPRVAIEPDQVFALSLALGELATNAQKYGAWSKVEGRVLINWDIRDNLFHLTWREAFGPPIAPREAAGFGSELIENALAQVFRGKAVLEFPPSGVIFTLQAPTDGQIKSLPPMAVAAR